VKFQNSNWPPSNVFKQKLKKPKNGPQGARGWGSESYFFTRIFIYISKELMQKFETLQQPSGILTTAITPTTRTRKVEKYLK
jgi:hypothetical protein